MDMDNRIRIRKNAIQLCQEMEADELLPQLCQNYILTLKEWQSVTDLNTIKEKNGRLVSLILNKKQEGYEGFEQVLRAKQPHLAELIENTVITEEERKHESIEDNLNYKENGDKTRQLKTPEAKKQKLDAEIQDNYTTSVLCDPRSMIVHNTTRLPKSPEAKKQKLDSEIQDNQTASFPCDPQSMIVQENGKVSVVGLPVTITPLDGHVLVTVQHDKREIVSIIAFNVEAREKLLDVVMQTLHRFSNLLPKKSQSTSGKEYTFGELSTVEDLDIKSQINFTPLSELRESDISDRALVCVKGVFLKVDQKPATRNPRVYASVWFEDQNYKTCIDLVHKSDLKHRILDCEEGKCIEIRSVTVKHRIHEGEVLIYVQENKSSVVETVDKSMSLSRNAKPVTRHLQQIESLTELQSSCDETCVYLCDSVEIMAYKQNSFMYMACPNCIKAYKSTFPGICPHCKFNLGKNNMTARNRLRLKMALKSANKDTNDDKVWAVIFPFSNFFENFPSIKFGDTTVTDDNFVDLEYDNQKAIIEAIKQKGLMYKCLFECETGGKNVKILHIETNP